MKPQHSKLFDVPTMMLREELTRRGTGWLTDGLALAAIVLWASGRFDTFEIAQALAVKEDAVCRTLRMARDGAKAEMREAAE